MVYDGRLVDRDGGVWYDLDVASVRIVGGSRRKGARQAHIEHESECFQSSGDIPLWDVEAEARPVVVPLSPKP